MKRPGREISPVHSARAPLGPSAQQLTARPPNRPGAAPLLGHIWPIRRPPFPAVRRRRSGSSGRALFSRKQKPGDDASPANPRLISPLCLLSPQNGGSHGAREKSHGAAAGPLAGARAPLCGSTPPSSGLAVVPFRSPRVEKQPESTSGGSDLCRRAGPLLSSRAAGDRRWSLWLNPGKAPPPFFS